MNVIEYILSRVDDSFDKMTTWESAFIKIATGTHKPTVFYSYFVVIDCPDIFVFINTHLKTLNIVFKEGVEQSLAENLPEQ